MERLTKYGDTSHENGVCCTHFNSKECNEVLGNCAYGCKWEEEAWSKLASYEDAEEQGLLLRLPCNDVFESSGDSVYYIFDYEIAECINCGVSLDCEGVMWIALACDESIFPYREPMAEFDTDPTDWCTHSTDVRIEEWGKTIFLTRAEAEKALAEVE